jgi:hypothetical protein
MKYFSLPQINSQKKCMKKSPDSYFLELIVLLVYLIKAIFEVFLIIRSINEADFSAQQQEKKK